MCIAILFRQFEIFNCAMVNFTFLFFFCSGFFDCSVFIGIFTGIFIDRQTSDSLEPFCDKK